MNNWTVVNSSLNFDVYKCPHFKIRLCFFLMQGRRSLKYSFIFFLFFLFFLFCLSLIMDLVLRVHKALVWVKSGLPSSRCCILQICHPRCLPMVLIIWPMHKFFFYFFFFSWALGPHGFDHTQKAFPPDCKPTLVLLGKSVMQLSCPASPFFFFF